MISFLLGFASGAVAATLGWMLWAATSPVRGAPGCLKCAQERKGVA